MAENSDLCNWRYPFNPAAIAKFCLSLNINNDYACFFFQIILICSACWRCPMRCTYYLPGRFDKIGITCFLHEHIWWDDYGTMKMTSFLVRNCLSCEKVIMMDNFKSLSVWTVILRVRSEEFHGPLSVDCTVKCSKRIWILEKKIPEAIARTDLRFPNLSQRCQSVALTCCTD